MDLFDGAVVSSVCRKISTQLQRWSIPTLLVLHGYSYDFLFFGRTRYDLGIVDVFWVSLFISACGLIIGREEHSEVFCGI